MGDRILVRGSFKTWLLWVPVVLAAAAAGLGYWVADNDWLVLQRFLIASGVFLAAALIVAVVLFRRRRWLEITEDGFVVIDRGGPRRFTDEQVNEMAVYWRYNYSEGVLKSSTCFLSLWLEGTRGTERVDMNSTCGTDEESPAGILVERLTARLYEKAADALNRGRALEGDGWKLEREGFTVIRKPRPELIPFSDVGATGVFDDHLCIWKKGEEEPAVKIPPTSKNYGILQLLLNDFVTGEEETGELPPGYLGRVLFDRKSSPWVYWLLCLAGLGGGGLLIAEGYQVWGVVVILLGVLFAFVARRARRTAFRCHEYGVEQVGLFGGNKVLYADIRSFTYGATRVFVNGVYRGTDLVMRFDPLPGKGRAIHYTESVHGRDDELDNLREHISNVIARRMLAELGEGRPVQWTSNMRFLPEGIEYQPKGFIGRKEPIVIPYGEVANFDIVQGNFVLHREGQEKPAISEAVAQPNFFPGFRLLVHLFTPDGEEASAGEEASDTEAVGDEAVDDAQDQEFAEADFDDDEAAGGYSPGRQE